MEKESKQRFRLTKLERAWILYDVGNSAFVLMVATLIPIFFNALAAAGVAVMGAWARLRIPCTYALLERVKLEIEGCGGVVDDVQYAADVALLVSLPAERTETLRRKLTELSAGGITVELLAEEYRPGPRADI